MVFKQHCKETDSSFGKESSCSAGDPVSIPGLGRCPWRREWLPTPVFWPGEFHGLDSPWGRKSRTRLSDFHLIKETEELPGWWEHSRPWMYEASLKPTVGKSEWNPLAPVESWT